MANSQLIEYIKKVQLQGFPEATIREVLSKNGWQPSDVNEAFIEIQSVVNALQKDAPMAPGAAPFQPQIQPQVVSQFTATAVKSHKVEYNSPFSIGLAVVLLGSLFILVNKVITDSSTFTSNVNGKLIFDAFIILPYLVMAFILHGSFSNENKKFLIISQPYFIASAFLVIRLLWDTSAYILNTNATYGVYVVLLMIIAVLTGIILFIQKYIRN